MKFKKMVSVLLTGLICFTSISFVPVTADETTDVIVWDGSADSFWYNDTDTEFYISTAEELAGLSKLVNSGNSMEGKVIHLTNDIYLNDVSKYESWSESNPDNSWTSIGIDGDDCFKGNFSGGNHTIFGLYGQAVFGNAASGARIQNLKLEQSYITEAHSYISSETITSSWFLAGSICGYSSNDSVISHCSNDGRIDIKVKNATNYYSYGIGGICGFDSGNLIYCSNKGNISFVSNAYYYYSYGGYVNVGGICGQHESGSIENCNNNSNIECMDTNKAYKYFYTGGVCGSSDGTVINCYNKGSVNSPIACGGISGVYYGSENDKMLNCYNTGVITSDGLSGGVVGKLGDSSEYVENCYYLNVSALRGIGDVENDTIINPNEAAMKKESFAQTLGDAFVYAEGDFPKLAWEVYGIVVEGDINNDGMFTLADVIILQKYLLNAYSMNLDEWNRSDVCADGSVNAFDLCVLKRMLISK